MNDSPTENEGVHTEGRNAAEMPQKEVTGDSTELDEQHSEGTSKVSISTVPGKSFAPVLHQLSDDDLEMVVQYARLPDEIQAGIRAMVEAAASQSMGGDQ